MSSCNISVRHRLRVSFPLSERSIRNEEFSNDYRGAMQKKALLSSMDQCIRFSARACVPTHLCLGAENPFAIATNACLLLKSSNGCVNQRLGPNNSNNNISSQRPKRPNAIAKCHPLGSVQLYYRGLLPSLPTK